MSNFIPLSELLKLDTQYLKKKTERIFEKLKEAKKIYEKTKNPRIKKIVKELENMFKHNIKYYNNSKKLYIESSKELSKLRKDSNKILSLN